MNILNINLDLIFNGLTVKEQEILETVKTKYFKDLGNIAWDEGIWDLDIYKKDSIDKHTAFYNLKIQIYYLKTYDNREKLANQLLKYFK